MLVILPLHNIDASQNPLPLVLPEAVALGRRSRPPPQSPLCSLRDE